MEIGSKINQPINEQSVQRVADQKQQQTASPGQASTVADEKLSLTPLTKDMIGILESAQTNDVDIAKVDALKTAIENGEYSVDAGKIADALISMEKDLP